MMPNGIILYSSTEGQIQYQNKAVVDIFNEEFKASQGSDILNQARVNNDTLIDEIYTKVKKDDPSPRHQQNGKVPIKDSLLEMIADC